MVEEQKKEGDKQKVVKLDDGTILNEYCWNRLSSHEVNTEAIYDILDVLTDGIGYGRRRHKSGIRRHRWDRTENFADKFCRKG